MNGDDAESLGGPTSEDDFFVPVGHSNIDDPGEDKRGGGHLQPDASRLAYSSSAPVTLLTFSVILAGEVEI